MKSQQKKFINNLFTELDDLHSNNPRGYMNLVKSLRDGTFDRKVSEDSSFVSPENWKKHFSNLLGPQIPPSPEDDLMAKYVTENCDKLGSELENPFSRSELMEGISSLDNNKSSSFDRISNEILKASKQIISEPVLILFNAILSSSLYPTSWKYDILTPLHKSNEKN